MTIQYELVGKVTVTTMFARRRETPSKERPPRYWRQHEITLRMTAMPW